MEMFPKFRVQNISNNLNILLRLLLLTHSTSHHITSHHSHTTLHCTTLWLWLNTNTTCCENNE